MVSSSTRILLILLCTYFSEYFSNYRPVRIYFVTETYYCTVVVCTYIIDDTTFRRIPPIIYTI